MAKPIIGGDQWRDLMRAFVSEFSRQPTKAERRQLEKLAGFSVPAKKTKGKATDYHAKGATPWQAARSESINGGIASDKERGHIMLKRAARLNGGVTAKA